MPCQVLAYLGAGEQRDIGSNLRIGCAASCGKDDSATIGGGRCSGIGCCQTAIPKGIKYYKAWFDDRFNTSSMYTWNRCAYAALVEESSFNFSMIYDSSSKFNSDTVSSQPPFVVDWVMGNISCKEARKNLGTYPCISNNSICLDSQNGPGYICNCRKGFQGNPYNKGLDSCQGDYLQPKLLFPEYIHSAFTSYKFVLASIVRGTFSNEVYVSAYRFI